jgi:hypothetical protein
LSPFRPESNAVARSYAIRDEAVADILERWRLFSNAMTAAGNPGLRPLYTGTVTPAWQKIPDSARRKAKEDLGWLLYESEYTVPILLRPDGTVGGLKPLPLREHLLTDARYRARIDGLGYVDDEDGFEAGDVAHVTSAMRGLVQAWMAYFTRILERTGVSAALEVLTE